MLKMFSWGETGFANCKQSEIAKGFGLFFSFTEFPLKSIISAT